MKDGVCLNGSYACPVRAPEIRRSACVLILGKSPSNCSSRGKYTREFFHPIIDSPLQFVGIHFLRADFFDFVYYNGRRLTHRGTLGLEAGLENPVIVDSESEIRT